MKTLMVPLSLLVAGVAAAQPSTFLSDTRKPLESPRTMYIEVKLGSYKPDIDGPFMAQPEASRPYYAAFGSGSMLLGTFEASYQFFQKFGSLAAGLSVGYAEKFGKALDPVSGLRTDQSTGLRLFPLKLQLIYRWDYAKQKWNVPLVPYLKGGAMLVPWIIYSGTDVEQFGVDQGAGTTFGLTGTFGLALQLDFLDPRLARDFDSSVGVNHTYLFAEGTIDALNLWYDTAARPLDFSSKYFMFGLGFEL